MSETTSGGVRIVFEDMGEFEIEDSDVNALQTVDQKFRHTVHSLTQHLLPSVVKPFDEYCNRDTPDYKEKQDDEVIDYVKASLDFARSASSDELEEAIRYQAMGLFVMAGLDHEDNPDENFEKIVSELKEKYNSMAPMSDEELREHLRFSDEEESEILEATYSTYISGGLNSLMRALLHNQAGPELTPQEAQAAIVHEMMHSRRGEPENGVNIYGLTLDQTEVLAMLLIEGIVQEGLLDDGYKMVRLDSKLGETLSYQRRLLKMRRFLLHTVINEDTTE